MATIREQGRKQTNTVDEREACAKTAGLKMPKKIFLSRNKNEEINQLISPNNDYYNIYKVQ